MQKLIIAALLLSGPLVPLLAQAGFFDNNNAQSEFLSADEAFVLEALGLNDKQVQLRWTIAPEYYLYKHRLGVELIDSTGQRISWRAPRGKIYHDEHFGEVEIYHNVLEFPVSLSQPSQQISLRLHWQGCAEAGLCYPPQKRELTVELKP